MGLQAAPRTIREGGTWPTLGPLAALVLGRWIQLPRILPSSWEQGVRTSSTSSSQLGSLLHVLSHELVLSNRVLHPSASQPVGAAVSRKEPTGRQNTVDGPFCSREDEEDTTLDKSIINLVNISFVWVPLCMNSLYTSETISCFIYLFNHFYVELSR